MGCKLTRPKPVQPGTCTRTAIQRIAMPFQEVHIQMQRCSVYAIEPDRLRLVSVGTYSTRHMDEFPEHRLGIRLLAQLVCNGQPAVTLKITDAVHMFPDFHLARLHVVQTDTRWFVYGFVWNNDALTATIFNESLDVETRCHAPREIGWQYQCYHCHDVSKEGVALMCDAHGRRGVFWNVHTGGYTLAFDDEHTKRNAFIAAGASVHALTSQPTSVRTYPFDRFYAASSIGSIGDQDSVCHSLADIRGDVCVVEEHPKHDRRLWYGSATCPANTRFVHALTEWGGLRNVAMCFVPETHTLHVLMHTQRRATLESFFIA